MRADSAGATHGLTEYCRELRLRFFVGYELTESVRTAILELLKDARVRPLDQDGTEQDNDEIADRVDLSSWPEDRG